MRIEDLEQQIQVECRFCSRPDKDRILHETSNFYIMLSLGPIVEGYLLLISKEHLGCCAEIPEDMASEFEYLYNKIIQIQQKVYGHSVAYEHGRAGSCMVLTEGSKHCYHAHMHFLPALVKLNEEVSKDFDSICINGFNEFKSAYKEIGGAYMYVDDGRKELYCIDTQIRRQYLRYKVSKLIGRGNLWDWINNQGWEKIKTAKDNYIKYFHDFTY
jgi:ATP adenylyltransferase